MINELSFLEKLYLCVFNNKKFIQLYLKNETLAPLNYDVQEKILEVTVKNDICRKYPPPQWFKKMFLRILNDAVENYGSEHSEELLKEYTELISRLSEENASYKSYIINEDCIITLQENNSFVVKSTTGLQTWEASKYLAEWCINNQSIFHNKTIIELGSGIGLLGITILKMCEPIKYIFTDKSWEVLNILFSNLSINNLNSKDYDIQRKQLVWATICDEEAKNLSSDIILGADLVYDQSMIESLVHALKTLLTNNTTAYIASTIRDPDTDKMFLHNLESAGLVHEILDSHEKSIFVYNPSSIFVLYKIKVNVHT